MTAFVPRVSIRIQRSESTRRWRRHGIHQIGVYRPTESLASVLNIVTHQLSRESGPPQASTSQGAAGCT